MTESLRAFRQTTNNGPKFEKWYQIWNDGAKVPIMVPKSLVEGTCGAQTQNHPCNSLATLPSSDKISFAKVETQIIKAYE